MLHRDSSENCSRLRSLGIRHVLNAAYGSWCRRTVEEYKDTGIRFLGIEADDCESYQMHPKISENCYRLNDILGITHVLNAAYGFWCKKTMQEYKDLGVKFLGVEADDCESFEMFPKAAENYEMLNRYGVTHVLNAAHGFIDNEWEYGGMGIHYLGVDADDSPHFDISKFFDESADFIKQARKLGKVLVHCAVGFSRSPTLVVAYLMLYHRMSAREALKTIRAKRMIGPNRGFLRQLADFNNKLLAEGRIRPR
ncbi:DUSP3 [Branchiostoma lanceolatum]|uniref:protein-serine/threonine phosphatase n=1 Tax=Branchiostoma lanceolatum TaxID=7740 RepID=A0A8J9Z8C9_BRALA|nr:DUSP3 [Branchiostoma lanceolatum]